MAIGAAKDVQLITYALGSCIGLTAYDPVARLGGMLHFMLPEADNATMQPDDNDLMYAATGIPKLVDSMVARGAQENGLSCVPQEVRGLWPLVGRCRLVRATGRRCCKCLSPWACICWLRTRAARWLAP